jgi:hypothetical protein
MGRRTGLPYQAVDYQNAGLAVHGLNSSDASAIENDPSTQAYMAKTPSPMMHPVAAPSNNMMEMAPLPESYNPPSNGMIAFGDIPADISGFDAENQANAANEYSQQMMYDPASGMYMVYDWQAAYNQGYVMPMGDDQNGLSENYQMGGWSNHQNASNDHTTQLLARLSEKLVADKGGIDNGMIYGNAGYGENGMPIAESMTGPCDIMPGHEAWDPSDMYAISELDGNSMAGAYPHEQGHQTNEWNGRKNRNRDRGERRGDRGQGKADQGEQGEIENGFEQLGGINFTTVMFRNIPNKYTREMLVKQLEENLKGHFDFVYLPIDFKNKCNVGYAFINFRSIQACESFVNGFNGVEVRKCLSGLNSRKVTEVTPARVQGFEDNVQRLRNSPVMRELAHHQEWMPLIFDENGDQLQFPVPERPLEPIKPRRRGRDEQKSD